VLATNSILRSYTALWGHYPVFHHLTSDQVDTQ